MARAPTISGADRRDSVSEAARAADVCPLRNHRPAFSFRLRKSRRLPRACSARLTLTPEAVVVEEVTNSGLRGRGGAGFPTGIKWRTVLNTAGRSEIYRLQCG